MTEAVPLYKTVMAMKDRDSHNLRVLRRRDTTITSVLRQFSRVRLYHLGCSGLFHPGDIEGCMFLFGRYVIKPKLVWSPIPFLLQACYLSSIWYVYNESNGAERLYSVHVS